MKIFKKLFTLAIVAFLISLATNCSSSETQINASGVKADTSSNTQMEESTEAEEPAEAEESTEAEEPAEAFPVTLQTAMGELTLEAQPVKILSLSPTATEILFAIGAGEQVFAVDDQSNYPPEAPISDISGWSPNLEAILAMEPDLVVHSYLPEDIEQGLANVGIPSLTQFSAMTLEDTYQQIQQLGQATGNSEQAETVVSEMEQKIDDLVMRGSGFSPYTFYHELDQTYYSVTSTTFIGQVYAMIGLTNIADAADEAGSGYPQLSEEYILSQDPDLIFLADTKCCGQSAETVSERNGWSALTAVSEGKVIELDDDIASRWGPRVVDFFEAVVVAMEQVE
ncbi:MAG: ABC transporter substrate-binding protein [Acidimicrobiaceae bacterium]|nr:ABC transporter substrate-binding protein [Acidimicrobiaceae bacterium]